jgi:hypothetical protein
MNVPLLRMVPSRLRQGETLRPAHLNRAVLIRNAGLYLNIPAVTACLKGLAGRPRLPV